MLCLAPGLAPVLPWGGGDDDDLVNIWAAWMLEERFETLRLGVRSNQSVHLFSLCTLRSQGRHPTCKVVHLPLGQAGTNPVTCRVVPTQVHIKYHWSEPHGLRRKHAPTSPWLWRARDPLYAYG